jgi:hypothetical protein
MNVEGSEQTVVNALQRQSALELVDLLALQGTRQQRESAAKQLVELPIVLGMGLPQPHPKALDSAEGFIQRRSKDARKDREATTVGDGVSHQAAPTSTSTWRCSNRRSGPEGDDSIHWTPALVQQNTNVRRALYGF